jgi:hypothetical protein
MATMLSDRRFTFGITCVWCHEELIAPDVSEYRGDTHVRHLWHCSKCSARFESIEQNSSRSDDDGRYLSGTTRCVIQLALAARNCWRL